MRIMIDTNIFISAFVFQSSHMNSVIKKIIEEHRLVLSSYVIDELIEVVKRKFPKQIEVLDTFLTILPYELVYTPKKMRSDIFEIRDKKDYPVLYSAIIDDIDIFITGDKDFEGVDLEKPEIMSPSKFIEIY